MKWLRYARDGQIGFGVLENERVIAYRGELFGDKTPSGAVSYTHLTLPTKRIV